MSTTDILMTDWGDVACINGDFETGDGTQQHQADLLYAGKGEYKESPQTGVGIYNYVNSEDASDLIRETKDQFKKDGMEISKINYTQENLTIEAKYK